MKFFLSVGHYFIYIPYIFIDYNNLWKGSSEFQIIGTSKNTFYTNVLSELKCK